MSNIREEQIGDLKYGHWCNGRRAWTMEWNDIIFTDESRFCRQHYDGQIRDWRHRGERLLNCCVMHHHWSCTRYYDLRWYLNSLPHPSSTNCRYTEQPSLHLQVVGGSCPPIHSALAISHIPTG
ncbi:transposable element Tcb1 transposase [Trichonephila clavipes]|nr:transposable element Tcb1 transposase [Trichonephila clavipes]